MSTFLVQVSRSEVGLPAATSLDLTILSLEDPEDPTQPNIITFMGEFNHPVVGEVATFQLPALPNYQYAIKIARKYYRISGAQPNGATVVLDSTVLTPKTTTPSYSDLQLRVEEAIAEALLAAQNAGGGGGGGTGIAKNSAVSLAAVNEYFAQFTINDDGTDSASWPNRLAFEYKPNPDNVIGKHLTAWFNEYGEFRVTPAKSNTVPFRVFTKEEAADAEHSGTVPVMEVVWSRNDRAPKWGVMANGSMYVTGSIEIRPLVSGPSLQVGHLVLSTSAAVPAGTPAGTLIIRI